MLDIFTEYSGWAFYRNSYLKEWKSKCYPRDHSSVQERLSLEKYQGDQTANDAVSSSFLPGQVHFDLAEFWTSS